MMKYNRMSGSNYFRPNRLGVLVVQFFLHREEFECHRLDWFVAPLLLMKLKHYQ